MVLAVKKMHGPKRQAPRLISLRVITRSTRSAPCLRPLRGGQGILACPRGRRSGICLAGTSPPHEGSTKKELLLLLKEEGPSTDPKLIFNRFLKVAAPYWVDSDNAVQARVKLAGVTALTLGTTGVSVLFNFLGRDFFNYLSEKDVVNFYLQLQKYLVGFAIGIPVFVLRDYYLVRLLLARRCCSRPFYCSLRRGLGLAELV